MRTWYAVTPSQPFVSLPGDYNEMIRVMYGTQRLDFTSEDIADPWMNEGGQQNQFTIAGNSIWLLTYVDGATKLSMHYYAQLPTLSDANTTNWLLEDGPDIYLYAALLEAEPYLKNDARVAIWQDRLETALADLHSNDQDGQYSGSSLVMKNA